MKHEERDRLWDWIRDTLTGDDQENAKALWTEIRNLEDGLREACDSEWRLRTVGWNHEITENSLRRKLQELRTENEQLRGLIDGGY